MIYYATRAKEKKKVYNRLTDCAKNNKQKSFVVDQ